MQSLEGIVTKRVELYKRIQKQSRYLIMMSLMALLLSFLQLLIVYEFKILDLIFIGLNVVTALLALGLIRGIYPVTVCLLVVSTALSLIYYICVQPSWIHVIASVYTTDFPTGCKGVPPQMGHMQPSMLNWVDCRYLMVSVCSLAAFAVITMLFQAIIVIMGAITIRQLYRYAKLRSALQYMRQRSSPTSLQKQMSPPIMLTSTPNFEEELRNYTVPTPLA